MHIKLLRAVLCLPIAAATLFCRANSGLEVWAVNDSVRIDPIRNQPFEDNPKLFPDGMRPGYKQSNLIWDGTARRIRLKAARNETVAFQIVIERTGEKLSNVVVQPAELKGPNGANISLDNVDLFREWYVHVKNPHERELHARRRLVCRWPASVSSLERQPVPSHIRDAVRCTRSAEQRG